HHGLVVLTPAHGAPATPVRIDGPLTVDGAGTIALNGIGARAQITAGDGTSHLTLGSGQTLRGFGQVSVPMTNLGLVHADVAGNSLALFSTPKTNSSGFLASDDGILVIAGITITQDPSAVIAADDGLVQLNAATISGGLITS